MNLTRMREFNIEKRSVAAYQLYHDVLDLADQDIYNIIFHTFKGKSANHLILALRRSTVPMSV